MNLKMEIDVIKINFEDKTTWPQLTKGNEKLYKTDIVNIVAIDKDTFVIMSGIIYFDIKKSSFWFCSQETEEQEFITMLEDDIIGWINKICYIN